MVTNEEKTQFIHSLVKRIQRQEDDQTIKSDIQKLLLADSHGGKLYKYRAFNDLALENLETRTLHGSKPNEFNDPFDSRIGVDIESLIEAKFNHEGEIIEEVITEFLEVYYHRKELDQCSDKNKPIIINLMNNKQLHNFLNKYSGLSFDNIDVSKFIYQNFDVVINILSNILADDEIQKKIEFTNRMMPELYARMTPEGIINLPEHVETFESYIRNMGIEDDADEISLVKLLYMKQKPDDNDIAIKLDRGFSEIDKRINEAVNNMLYIVSLCVDNKNRLMWSHYADNHRGFCIEYDFSLVNLSDDVALISPVIYSSMRPKIPWKAYIATENSDKARIDKEIFTSLLLALLTKDEVWSYEREWRIFIPASKQMINIEAPPISCIYLGALCSDENKEKMVSIANRLGVQVKKMVVDRGEYSLHATSID